MNQKLHLVILVKQETRDCLICRTKRAACQHYDTDLSGFVCLRCFEAVATAECELLHARLEQPTRELVEANP